MTDRPIIFSGPMVRALLEGRKTQTRRLIKPAPMLAPHHEPVRPEPRGNCRWVWMAYTDRPAYAFATNDRTIRFEVGDRLYVRESLYRDNLPSLLTGEPTKAEIACFSADKEWCCDPAGFNFAWTWKNKALPAIHMPRWASRLTLTVTDVRVQRLGDISHDDAVAEGCYRIEPCEQYPHGNAWGRAGFAALWDRIHGEKAYDANPWVVALTFRVEQRNIDAKEAA